MLRRTENNASSTGRDWMQARSANATPRLRRPPPSSIKRCTTICGLSRSLGEVEDSLIVTRKIREQQAAQDRQVQALQRTLRLANLCYENGYWNFLEVLDGQRSLLAPSCSRYSSTRKIGGHRQSLTKRLAVAGCRNCSCCSHPRQDRSSSSV